MKASQISTLIFGNQNSKLGLWKNSCPITCLNILHGLWLVTQILILLSLQFMTALCSSVNLQGQKSLALDTAIGMWQLLFAEKQWPFVDHWCQFLQVA